MNLELIEHVVSIAHRGQTDKAGEPYIDHVRRVRACVHGEKHFLVSHLLEPWLATALCHDLLEDTQIPMWLLEGMLDASVIDAVRLLTRGRESYHEYIWNLVQSPSCDAKNMALVVKRWDLYDNLSTQRMSRLDPPTREKLCKRYYAALDVLEGRTWS